MMKHWFKNKYIYIYICLISFLLWLKFIKEKLPRDIPFNLSLLKLIIIIIICITLLHQIIITCFSKKKADNNIILNNLMKIAIFFDTEMKKHFFANKIYQVYIIKIVKIIIKYPHTHTILIIILRTILLTIFIVDIFVFNKIYWTYKIMYLLIITYSIKYIQFSLKTLKQNRTDYINTRANISINNNLSFILIDDFINIQTKQLRFKKPLINYIIILNLTYLEEKHKELNLLSNQRIDGKLLGKSMRGIISFILEINKYLIELEYLQIKYKYLTIFHNISYLVCWIYILFTANYEALSPVFLQIICDFNDNLDPFSQTFL